MKLLRIDEFTVGLAASEKSFDEGAFFQLLKSSLQEAATKDSNFSTTTENDEQQLAKIRGMLVQQYLSEQKVPIRISSLTYKLKEAKADFKIGGAMVPRDDLTVEKTADGLVRCSYKGAIPAQMERDAAGKYSISYEDSSGDKGTVNLTLKDVEFMEAEQPAQTARRGDISFNWQLSMEKLQVYRIANFSGDMGLFMHRMRYPKLPTSLNQYQTIRDSVFLFGYGPYATGLVNRIETPTYISQVEVMPITEAVFQQLEGGIAEEELLKILSENPSRWMQCNFVEFESGKKVWEWPVAVGFPFLSRQTSDEKKLIFYAKYDQKGPLLIGDYRRGK
ncbi:MAG: hypothetical protein HY717_05955 [Planctomycetes bacterium]|nr:hypothetical protein [Planctomycetota bacterium]